MNNLLSAYGGDDASSSSSDTLTRLPTATTSTNESTIDVAPPVQQEESEQLAKHRTVALDAHAVSLNANVRADTLFAPVVTVAHPLQRSSVVGGQLNSLTGFVESHHMNAYQFSEQFELDRRRHAGTVRSVPLPKRPRGDVTGSWWGSWAPPDELDETPEVALGADSGAVTDEQAAEIDARNEARKVARVAAAKAKAESVAAERSVFHGKQLTDYQGRTYIWPPTDAKPADHKCYLPKTLLHTYAGHTKAVNRVRFFPRYGHLLLSASMDTTIKVWDLRKDNERICLRTMYGHGQAVREVAFNGDGKTFLSCGFDKHVRHWDTETGQCVARLGNGAMPFCAQYYPVDENLLLAGAGDSKVYQWDLRANAVVQTYFEHQGAINTITFFDENRRFMSTSDDKKILLWEFGIPVVIKHISDPEMHAVPAVATHPSGEYIACQNLNNTITVYEVANGTVRHKNKVFKGHMAAGYACDVAFSPDGQYIMSGDGNGNCVFWDWARTVLYSKLKCHDGVAISAQWHPIEPSQVVTAGWDGTIKLWS